MYKSKIKESGLDVYTLLNAAYILAARKHDVFADQVQSISEALDRMIVIVGDIEFNNDDIH